ncbi:HupE/UreJ family protein [Roseomonas sp. SG15]|uniref:HupE/UreJ family protein n=2 Tax=Roseomonas indoligenes TaxID=2820811 RepID=A0A940N680_9PROT|nr:HupE/UreJ family protein [Pararoseomonas indoligenes]MBP0495860.1 HupE/UreJ family protein [Pararoseomonas indoligenes]
MRRLLPLALALLPLPALAHTGLGHVAGFTAGFAHPLGGADHLMAMVAIGLWAGLMGGRAAWALPLAFLGAMTVGGALGMAGIGLPMVEAGIAGSVIVLGALVALAVRPPLAVALGLSALFGLVHGHAHGAEMLPGAAAAGYAAGFLLATAGLHALGLAIGSARMPGFRTVARVAGAGGVALMTAFLVLG